jgi:hypothetical protein
VCNLSDAGRRNEGGTRPKATDILPLLRETAENHWHRTLLRQYEVLERIQANGEISIGKTWSRPARRLLFYMSMGKAPPGSSPEVPTDRKNK